MNKETGNYGKYSKKKVEGNLVEFLLFCGSTKKISQKIQEVKRKFSSHLRFPVDTIELECDIYIVRNTFFGQHIHPTFSSYFTYLYKLCLSWTIGLLIRLHC